MPPWLVDWSLLDTKAWKTSLREICEASITILRLSAFLAFNNVSVNIRNLENPTIKIAVVSISHPNVTSLIFYFQSVSVVFVVHPLRCQTTYCRRVRVWTALHWILSLPELDAPKNEERYVFSTIHVAVINRWRGQRYIITSQSQLQKIPSEFWCGQKKTNLWGSG